MLEEVPTQPVVVFAVHEWNSNNRSQQVLAFITLNSYHVLGARQPCSSFFDSKLRYLNVSRRVYNPLHRGLW